MPHEEYDFDPETEKKFIMFFNAARQAGKQMELPDNFLEDLVKDLSGDNDWTFIIKAHAVMEGILNHILAEKLIVKAAPFDFKKEERLDFFTRLPINGRNGKAELAYSLGIIPKEMKAFIVRLSEIRNFYAHDLRNMSVSVETYVFERHRERKQEFYKAFCPSYEKETHFFHSLPERGIKVFIMMGLCAHISVVNLSKKHY